jgi:hypothetical protein
MVFLVLLVGTVVSIWIISSLCERWKKHHPSKEPVKKELYDEIGQETFSKFLFFISDSVTLTKVDRGLLINSQSTVVTATIMQNIIELRSSTTGRVQGTPTTQKLEIGFEKLQDGTIPTLSFIKKKEDGLYYFEQDSNGYIEYGGAFYTVTYEGKKEPYLLYQRVVQEKRSSRKMKGLK